MIKVEMKLSKTTIERVVRIQNNSQEKNRGNIMALGVKLLGLIIDEIKNGSKIYIYRYNGEREKISVKGILPNEKSFLRVFR